MNTWYIDSSIILRAVKEQSAAANTWFWNAVFNHDSFRSIRMTIPETQRTLRSAGADTVVLAPYLHQIDWLSVDDELMDEAADLEVSVPLRAADAIHLAGAMRIRDDHPIVVTHDARMAQAALELGLGAYDPITDDPGRGPVTAQPAT